MRRLVTRHPILFWLTVVALAVLVWVVFFVAGHGSVSGGSS